MKNVEASVKNIFWDVNVTDLDLERHRAFIIERVLEHGDEKAVRWLFKNFPRKAIISVTEKSRRLSPKSRNFWLKKFH